MNDAVEPDYAVWAKKIYEMMANAPMEHCQDYIKHSLIQAQTIGQILSRNEAIKNKGGEKC